MKKINLTLVLLFVLLSTIVNATNYKSISYNNKIFIGKIMYSSETCEIIEIEGENDNPLFLIIATALEFAAIEYGRSICVKVADPEICNAVADGVSLISGGFAAAKPIYRSAMNGSLNYTAQHLIENGIGKRVLNYATEGFSIAVGVKNVIEAYDKLKIIKWENLNYSDKLNTVKNNNGLKFYLKNNTFINLNIELSYDGIAWKVYTLNSGYSRNYQAHNGETIQNFGFIKINNCVFQLKNGYKYQINLDQNTNEYTITEK